MSDPNTPKFCGNCGGPLDPKTGRCPHCDPAAEPPAPNRKQLRKERKKQRKPDRKAARKQARKERRAALTTGQKVGRFFLNLFLLLLIFCLLGLLAAGVLAYYGVLEVPVVSDLVEPFRPQAEPSDNGGLYTPKENSVALDEETGILYVNNMILIFFDESATDKDVERIIDSIDGKIVGELPVIDQYQVEVETSTLEELEAICEVLRRDPLVVEAIYDTAFPIAADEMEIPDDPWVTGLFAKKETWSEDQPDGNNWWAEAIHAPSAWAHNDDFRKIKIGVVDNGFDTGHEDLKNRITSVDPVNNKEDHGSRVAGIIGAEANNGKGISGIVWNCELLARDWQLSTFQMIVDQLANIGWSTTNQILGDVSDLVKNGAKVVNLSIGTSRSMSGTTISQEHVDHNGRNASIYLARLLDYGYDFVVVQSSGNGNSSMTSVDTIYNGLFCAITEDNCFTTQRVSARDILDRIIVVGAAEQIGSTRFAQTYWSNAGDRVDICAPGADIYGPVPGGLSGSYSPDSGTSFAAPIVTGVSALVWSANRDLTGAQVKEIVCAEENTLYEVEDNTDSHHPLTNSYRLVNAELAVEAALAYDPEEEQTPSPAGMSTERDVVLVLDGSGSMDGTPIEETRKASLKFVDAILGEHANVGMVVYDSGIDLVSELTWQKQDLLTDISEIYSGGGTNIEVGLQQAEQMLREGSARKKMIVLMSDGEPNEGKEGDDLVAYADELKEDGIQIYTIGFFENLGSDRSGAQQLMERIASEGCHYEVARADDLVFFFEDIGDQISGQKFIYIRIACPVEVAVTHHGETLKSAGRGQNLRTDFGTITFEEAVNEETGAVSEIKILRLKEGTDYDVQITGTGYGLMNYTIGFMDEDGEYDDFRTFEHVRISKDTVIDTVASVSAESVLNIDDDGDGTYDLQLRAGENEEAAPVEAKPLQQISPMVWIILGAAGVLIVCLIILLCVKTAIRKKEGHHHG